MPIVSSSFSDLQSRSSSHGDPPLSMARDILVEDVYIRVPRGIPLPDAEDDPADMEGYVARRKRFARDVANATGIRFPDGSVLKTNQFNNWENTHTEPKDVDSSLLTRLTEAIVFVDHYAEGKDWGLADMEELIRLIDTCANFKFVSPDDVNRWGICPDLKAKLSLVKDTQSPFYPVSLKVGTLRHTIRSISVYRNWLDRQTSDQEERRRMLCQNILAGILPTLPTVMDAAAIRKYDHEMLEFQLEAARMNAPPSTVRHVGVLGAPDPVPVPVVPSVEDHMSRPRKVFKGYTGTKWSPGCGLTAMAWVRMFEKDLRRLGISHDNELISWFYTGLTQNYDTSDWLVKVSSIASWDELRTNFIHHFMRPDERDPGTIWAKVMRLSREPETPLRDHMSNFQFLLANLKDANAMTVNQTNPTNRDLSTAWLRSLEDEVLCVLATRIHKDLPIDEVLRQTYAIWEDLQNTAPNAVREQGMSSALISNRPIREPSRKTVLQETTTTRKTTGYRAEHPAAPVRVSPPAPLPARAVAPAAKPTPTRQPAPRDDKEVSEITKAMSELKIKRGTDKRRLGRRPFTCFRCGKEGHSSRQCNSDTPLPTWKGYFLMKQDPTEDPEYHETNEDEYMVVYRLMIEKFPEYEDSCDFYDINGDEDF
ncbi:hypothetical protein HDU86_001145 [Geranomyces michiganensis]|nr:hypothetical protein HDU86_001145 [Geranomyces michiganensis]